MMVSRIALSPFRSSHPMSTMISGPRVTRWVEMKFRTGFVHSHRTPIEHLSVQRINSRLGFRCLRHLDKSDTAGLARVPVHDDHDGFDGSMHCKNFSQLLLRYRDIKVADKNVGHEVILPLMFPNILQLGTHKLIFKWRSCRISPFRMESCSQRGRTF